MESAGLYATLTVLVLALVFLTVWRVGQHFYAQRCCFNDQSSIDLETTVARPYLAEAVSEPFLAPASRQSSCWTTSSVDDDGDPGNGVQDATTQTYAHRPRETTTNRMTRLAFLLLDNGDGSTESQRVARYIRAMHDVPVPAYGRSPTRLAFLLLDNGDGSTESQRVTRYIRALQNVPVHVDWRSSPAFIDAWSSDVSDREPRRRNSIT